jgi:hypothetical protein
LTTLAEKGLCPMGGVTRTRIFLEDISYIYNGPVPCRRTASASSETMIDRHGAEYPLGPSICVQHEFAAGASNIFSKFGGQFSPPLPPSGGRISR